MGSIKIVPFYAKLLKVVAQDVARENKELSHVNVIFTHNRSIHFFNYYLSQYIDKPCFLGKWFGFEDWVKELFFEYGGEAATYTTLSEMEQAYVAYLAAMDILPEKYHQGFGEFFFWAFELSKIFREFDTELVAPQDVLYPPVEKVGDTGAMLLERVGKIYKKYNEYLEKNKWITHSKKLSYLAKIDDLKINGKFYFVGFFALTNAESLMLKKFYDADGVFYWQADYEDLPKVYKEWQRDWNISDLKPVKVEPDGERRKITFFDSHDLHTELKQVKNKLLDLKEKVKGPDEVAIIVPNPSSLIPILFHIPRELEINITMGYPFQLSGIYVLIDLLFKMILKKDERYGYPTNLFIKLLRGPYFREFNKFQVVVSCLVKRLDPFVTKQEAISLCYEFSEEIEKSGVNTYELVKFIEDFFSNIIAPFEGSKSLKELGEALISLLDFVESLEIGLETIEKEFVFYLLGTINDSLSWSIFSNVTMKTPELYSIAKNIMTSLKVPFEGEPIKGIQIMGVLESRDLGFDHLMIIDANEGILPSVPTPSPLLPQELRQVMGFSTRGKEENIYAYHFERLVKSSIDVSLLYQNKTVSTGSLEGKRTKSRFIEKLIWDFEKQIQKIIKDSDTVFKTKDYTVEMKKSKENITIPEINNIVLEKSEDIKKNISSMLNFISPTMLNTYIKCPKKFLFQYVLKLTTTSKIDQIPTNEIGNIVHKTLELFFREYINADNSIILKKDLNFDSLFDIFLRLFNENSIFKKISRSKKEMFVVSAKYRLKNFLENLPEKTEIIALEKEMQLELALDKNTYILKGKIDRIDKRDDYIFILDYKTGRIPNSGNIFREFEIPSINDVDGFYNLYRYLKDIQIPFYIYLYGHKNDNFKNIIGGFVDLSKDGREILYKDVRRLKPDFLDQYDDFFKYTFKDILKFLVNHIKEGPIFGPVEPNFCRFCDYMMCCANSN